MRALRYLLVGTYLALACLPLLWMGVTSIKPRADTTSVNARWLPAAPSTVSSNDDPRFPVSLDGYRALSQSEGGSSRSFWFYLGNSVLIGLLSTFASVVLGTLCAYGFSRFPIVGARDWLFFVLSTRFMPPLAVVVPLVLMYGQLGLRDTHLGLVLLYTGFNLSLAVWLMKGFLDDIPRAYEEAALVDGYGRIEAFWRVVVPQARGGMAVTAVFCLISAWNEYGFALTLTSSRATTVPVFFAGLQGNISGIPWPQIGAGALLFVAPIVVFTVLVRKHLLRGMTFGTIKQ